MSSPSFNGSHQVPILFYSFGFSKGWKRGLSVSGLHPIYSFCFPFWNVQQDMALVSYHLIWNSQVFSKNYFGICVPPLDQLEQQRENYSFFMTSVSVPLSWRVLFQVKQSLQNVVSAPSLKVNLDFYFCICILFFIVHPQSWIFSICFQDINVISKVVEASRNHDVSNGNHTPEDSRNHEVSNGNHTPEDTNSGASSPGRFGLWFPSFRTPFLSRSLSGTNSATTLTFKESTLTFK